MKTKILLSLLCLSSVALAYADEDNLPDLNQPQTEGRLAIFPTNQNVVWFAPMAFSSNLDCTPPSSSGERACFVRIYNRITDQEQAAMQHFVKAGQVVGGFRDVDSIVHSVNESFSDLNSQLQTGVPMLLKTLVMDNRNTYASIALRVNSPNYKSLSQAYEEDGLGKFVSEVHFSGEYTGDYIAIQETSILRRALENLASNPVSLTETKNALKNALKASSLSLNNYSVDEANTIAVSHLVKDYFTLGRQGRLYVRNDQLSSLPAVLVVLNETSSAVDAHCIATLELKKDATSTIKCGEDL